MNEYLNGLADQAMFTGKDYIYGLTDQDTCDT
jgi:hypothetical protein